MATDLYLIFLAIGVLMIVADGVLIYRSGRRYLSSADGDTTAGGSLGRLVVVLFHLVMFGFLALLSVFDFDFGDGNSVRAVVGNLGVLLLVLAIVHAVMIAVLSNLHDNQAVEDRMANRGGVPGSTNADIQRGPVVAPVPGQKGRDPRVSPSIENERY
ncbi:hypothetical protein [Qaidamihabitans albus]|uniref:hypothetical protein n=1 Tax=Qaidamihabitans albus TaxID=2795733 RepID=UPI0018F1ABBF|nr:hypothetical protein [Qaidamihabitans albus]